MFLILFLAAAVCVSLMVQLAVPEGVFTALIVLGVVFVWTFPLWAWLWSR